MRAIEGMRTQNSFPDPISSSYLQLVTSTPARLHQRAVCILASRASQPSPLLCAATFAPRGLVTVSCYSAQLLLLPPLPRIGKAWPLLVCGSISGHEAVCSSFHRVSILSAAAIALACSASSIRHPSLAGPVVRASSSGIGRSGILPAASAAHCSSRPAVRRRPARVSSPL
jgi:hypothetical protein